MTTTDPTPLVSQIAHRHQQVRRMDNMLPGCTCDPSLMAPSEAPVGVWFSAHIATVTERAVRERVAAEIERAYLGPDSGRHHDGRDAPDANLRQAFDEGLERAARITRGAPDA